MNNTMKTKRKLENPAEVKPHKIKKPNDKESNKTFKKSPKSLSAPPKDFKKIKVFQKNGSLKNKFPPKGNGEKLAPPNWAEFKKKKKELRETRRINKVSKTQPDVHNVIIRAKALGEKLRRKKDSPEARVKLTEELHKLLHCKGNYKRLVLAHDTTRIIQWLLKYSSPQIRQEISTQLMPLIMEMMLSKYARNCVKQLLKYGSSETRNHVLTAFHGNIVKLASHTLCAPILDYAYAEIADQNQKSFFQQEFYGDIYKTNKDASIHNLRDTFKKSPEIKNAMLGATKANLLRVLNKNVHDCGVVHAVLYNYLMECSSEDRSELITTMSPLIVPLSNSKLGTKAAILCVWHGTNKDKKTILKVMKEHAVSLSTHEHGHQLVLAALSCVDDTVLLTKALLSTIFQDISTVVASDWGRKVLMWLVAPGNPAHFQPSLTTWLEGGAVAGGSKKPQEVRRAEVLQASLPDLLAAIQQNPETWLASGNIGLLTISILKAATGDILQSALVEVSKYICRPDWTVTEEGKEVNGIEHTGLHTCLKKLAQHDKINIQNNQYTFGEAICNQLNTDIVKSWIKTNRGCFFLLTVFENNSEEVQKKLIEILLPLMKKLQKQSTAGAKLLMSKIK